MPRRLVNVVPSDATRRLAASMIRDAAATTGADSALKHMPEMRADQLVALIGVLLTATKQHRKPGRAPVPSQFTAEERRRGWSQYRQGVRTEFAVAAAREYRRMAQRALRRREGLKEAG